MDFYDKNDNELSIKDITITCDYDAPSGTLSAAALELSTSDKGWEYQASKSFSMGSSLASKNRVVPH